MNRRGFISLLAGGAGAVLVPWRGLVKPVISLPPPAEQDLSQYLTSRYSWFLRPDAHPLPPMFYREPMGEKSLEETLEWITRNFHGRIALHPTHLIVHPSWTREHVEERLKTL
jgi:hypothetical protein